MPANRTFDFPVRTHLRASKRLDATLVDTTTGPAIARRLSKKNPDPTKPDIAFAPLFDAQIQLEDTDALDAAIGLLDGGDTEHEAAKDKKKGFTQGRNFAANALYKMCLSIQNAARLAYPATQAAKDEATLVARNRFLLDEFPPRGGASAGDKPVTPPAP